MTGLVFTSTQLTACAIFSWRVEADHASARVASSSTKRIVDILLASFGLLLCAPLFCLLWGLITLESRGPAIYRSRRVGFRGAEFVCLKFRTMAHGAEDHVEEYASLNMRKGAFFKANNDPRITRLGAVLRKYSLDELPQLLNVLRGEMSLVGPRPPLPCEVAQYAREHFRRLSVIPGLTGLWQVRARRDPSFDKYIDLDNAYIDRWSLLLDAQIMLLTMGAILKGTGI